MEKVTPMAAAMSVGKICLRRRHSFLPDVSGVRNRRRLQAKYAALTQDVHDLEPILQAIKPYG
jgi:hypothetical protein